MKVNISIRATETTIREIDPTDSWDVGDFGLEIHGVEVQPTERDSGYEIDASPGDAAVVLVEHYSDGCTFGSNEYADIKGVFRTQEEAERIASGTNTSHGYFGSHIAFLYFDVTLPGSK